MYPESKHNILSDIINGPIPPLRTYIARGTFGVVEKLTDPVNGQIYALKTIDLNPTTTLDEKYSQHYKSIMNEIEILFRLNQIAPGIFPIYYDHLEIPLPPRPPSPPSPPSPPIPTSPTLLPLPPSPTLPPLPPSPTLPPSPQFSKIDKIMILMEFIEGSELMDFIKHDFVSLTYQQRSELIIVISLDLLKSLKILHDNGIVHRDLKLENIRINFDKANVRITSFKLIDFGLSCFDPSVELDDILLDEYKNTCWTRFCGSPHYVAPQTIDFHHKLTPGDTSYDFSRLKSADIWSFGVMLYIMVHIKYPFLGINTHGIFKSILDYKNLPFPKTYLESEFNQIMNEIFVKRDLRISIEKLIEKFDLLHQKYATK